MPLIHFLKNIREYHKERKRTSIDKSIIYLFPIVASLIALIFRTNHFITIFLFLCVPGIYLSIRYPLNIKRALLFTFTLLTPLSIIVSYIAHVTYTWNIPSSILDPHRFLGIVPIEEVLFAVAYGYLVVMYYESFLDRHVYLSTYSKQFKYLFYLVLFLIIFFMATIILNPQSLYIDYFYLKMGGVLILVPIGLVLRILPSLWSKFSKTIAYFSVLFIIYEFTALTLEHWEFPMQGQYLAYIHVFNFNIPFEEIFFWLFFLEISLLSYFEFFEGDYFEKVIMRNANG